MITPDLQLDGGVNAIQLAGDKLYLAGGFFNVAGLPRRGLVALDASTFQPTAWNPQANNLVGSTDRPADAPTNQPCAHEMPQAPATLQFRR